MRTQRYHLTGVPLDVELVPGSPDWLRAVTASKVATILGLTPQRWETRYSLWHKMAGIAPAEPQTAAMTRGHEFEPLIRRWCDEIVYGDIVETGTWQHPERKDWYANPDGLIIEDHRTRLLEIKTAANLYEWGDEVPPYYLAQVMWQMHVTGAQETVVAACGPFEMFDRKPKLFKVAYDRNLAAGIGMKVDDFMRSLADGEVPDRVDASDPTVTALRWRNPNIEKTPPVQVPAEIAVPYLQAHADADRLKQSMATAKATLLEWMGNAKEAEYDGQVIATRTNSRSGPPSLRKAAGTDTLNAEIEGKTA